MGRKIIVDVNKTMPGLSAVKHRPWKTVSIVEFGVMVETLNINDAKTLWIEVKAALKTATEQLEHPDPAWLVDPNWIFRARTARRYIYEKSEILKAVIVRKDDEGRVRNIKNPSLNWRKSSNWHRWHVFRALEFLDVGDLEGARKILTACKNFEQLDEAPKIRDDGEGDES